MNAGLPMPTVSPGATPLAPDALPSATPGSALAPTDFMIALAQMVGAATQVKTEAELGSPVATADTDASDEAAALALLPLPIAQLPPQVAQGQAQSGACDPIEMLGLAAKPEGASARDAALLQAMTDRLAAVTESVEPGETPVTPTPPTIDPQQPVRTTSDGAITRPVHVPVGTPGWADEIGSRLTLMTQKGEHTASLRLSPEHLGPLEIRIAMRDDQASVWFGAAHADTRAAIEHALPRLREMFSASGMSLADAGVFREPPKQQPQAFASDSRSGADGSTGANDAVAATAVKIGLLDAYA